MTIDELENWIASIPDLQWKWERDPQMKMDSRYPWMPDMSSAFVQYEQGPVTLITFHYNGKTETAVYQTDSTEGVIHDAVVSTLARLGLTPPARRATY